MSCSDRASGNKVKLKEGKFRLGIKEAIIEYEGGEAQKKLPRAVYAQTLEGIHVQGQAGWGFVQWGLGAGGWN